MKRISSISQSAKIIDNRSLEFERFFHAYYPILFKVGYQLCADKELTKDLLQSFFLELWESQFEAEQIKYLDTYLKKAFHRKVIKELQKKQKTQKQLKERINILGSTPAYEELLIHFELDSLKKVEIKKAMGKLSKQQKEMIKLRFYDGMDYEEIAQHTGNRKQTIYNQVHTAILKLRKALLLF